MCIDSVCFSLDGSLLAAGFGNCLCIYKSENLKIKAILTSTSYGDGIAKKVQIKLPNINNEFQKENETKKSVQDETQDKNNILEKFFNLTENSTQEITQIKRNLKSIIYKRLNFKNLNKLKKTENFEKTLFKKIMSLMKMNLFHKLYLYEKNGILCKISSKMYYDILKFIAFTILKGQQYENNFHDQIYKIEKRYKFKAKCRLYKYKQQKYQNTMSNRLIPLIQSMNFDSNYDNSKQRNYKNINKRIGFHSNVSKKQISTCILNTSFQSSPLGCIPSIKRVVFATADFAHLVSYLL